MSKKDHRRIPMILNDLAYKPGSVIDSHLSRPYVTAGLKPPIQGQPGQLKSLLRCCSG